jgi:putative NIF3 family GTP cyclohydrolase 1 type 2
MTIHEIITPLNQLAAPELSEPYDNCGLLTGQPHHTCTATLTTLDVTLEVVMFINFDNSYHL